MSPQALASIAAFAEYLREHGFAVGSGEQRAMVQVILLCGDEVRRVESGWRALVCRSATEWRRYAQLFADFWFPARAGATVRTSGRTRRSADLRSVVERMHAEMEAAAHSRAGDTALSQQAMGEASEDHATSAQGGASRAEALERTTDSGWLPQDLTRLQRIVEAVAARLRRRLLRRQRHALHGQRLDWRRTWRASLRTDGIPFEPRWMQRRREQPRLLFMVDVSRSMETFAQLFLRIARAFVHVLDARVFVFHTRLSEVTVLLQRDSGRVQEKINAVTAGFGGGTRIATSLEALQVQARRSLTRAARVIIMSDGFDSDPPEQLARALRALRARGAKLYWLHPTQARPRSAALAGSGALIDAFAPVHDLESLARLDRTLT
jgi:uncharacterized protein with von Willebrand factor type A (vWA) domain